MITSVTNKQVKQVVPTAPYYFWDSLIVNNCTESVFNILRVEVIVAGQVRYLDLIIETDSKRFLGLGGTADSTIDFRVSVNMCKTYSLVAYMEDAS
jgi:hypothetical protein